MTEPIQSEVASLQLGEVENKKMSLEQGEYKRKHLAPGSEGVGRAP